MTIKENVLEMMDDLAASLKTTRSGMLEQAVAAFRRGPAVPTSISAVRPGRKKAARKATAVKNRKKRVSKAAARGPKRAAKKIAARRKAR